MIHWPVAFPPGNGLNPPHPTKEIETALDTETSLVETWKAMVALPKSKVAMNVLIPHSVMTNIS